MTPGTSTRTALKQTAIRLFVSKGYDGTSISDLTGELDITKAAFYHHFNSKIDLLLQIVDPVIRRTTELLETTRRSCRTRTIAGSCWSARVRWVPTKLTRC